MRSRLYNLSLELLEYTTTFLDVQGHLNLCLLSHQIHRHLLPSFLRRCQIGFSEDLTTLDALLLRHDTNIVMENAIFKLVNVSPWITNIRCLECAFDFPESRVLWQFSNIHRILKKTQNIESVTFDFSKISDWVLYTSSFPPAIRHRQTWDDLFFRIITALMEKPLCELTIISRQQHLWFIPFPFSSKYIPDMPRRAGLIRKWTAAIRSRFLLSSTAIPQSSFGTVDLSRITCLTLTRCHFVDSEWEAMSRLILPSLRELRTTKSMLSLTVDTLYHLFHFLKMHPSITRLHLREHMLWPASTFKSRDFLPKLRSVHAPISLIVAFFDPKFIGAKANLTDMEIICYPDNWDQWRGTFEWINRLPKQLGGVPTSMELSLDVSKWLRLVPSTHDTIVSISKLVMEFNCYDASPSSIDFWSKLHAWLVHFPKVELICINSLGGPITCHQDFAHTIYLGSLMTSVKSITIDGNLYLRDTVLTYASLNRKR